MDCRISNWRASVSEYASHFCNRSAGCLPIQGPLGVKTGTARTESVILALRKPEQRMTFKMKILFPIMSSLLFVVPSAAAEFTYQEYAKTPEVWKRGFVFGMSQYMSAVAQPDEEAPYPVRTAFQRCLASSTDTLLVREVEAYVAANPANS